jgi:hypothetical protein
MTFPSECHDMTFVARWQAGICGVFLDLGEGLTARRTPGPFGYRSGEVAMGYLGGSAEALQRDHARGPQDDCSQRDRTPPVLPQSG